MTSKEDKFVITVFPHQKKKSLGIYIAKENTIYKIATFKDEQDIEIFMKKMTSIGEDLKVLEILKNNLHIEVGDTYSHIYGWVMTREDGSKIKEWLENGIHKNKRWNCEK